MLYYIFVTIHIIVSLFLILVVLLQTGKSGDLASAFGGGGSQTVFGPRGTSNVLTKITTGAAIVFMITSLSLVFLSQQGNDSVVDGLEPSQPAAAETATGEPAVKAPVDEGEEGSGTGTGTEQ